MSSAMSPPSEDPSDHRNRARAVARSESTTSKRPLSAVLAALFAICALYLGSDEKWGWAGLSVAVAIWLAYVTIKPPAPLDPPQTRLERIAGGLLGASGAFIGQLLASRYAVWAALPIGAVAALYLVRGKRPFLRDSERVAWTTSHREAD